MGLIDRRAVRRAPGCANFRGIGQDRLSLERSGLGGKRHCDVKDLVNVEELELACIERWAENPREISPEARAGLRASLDRFGLVEPIVVNRRGRKLWLVSGHQRLDLLVAAGVRKARCVVVSIAEPEARAISITLNNRAIQGNFTAQVAVLIDELREDLGAEASELLHLEMLRDEVAAAAEPAAEGRRDPDAVPPAPKRPTSRRGDLWQMGDHRVFCGDATSEKDVARVTAGKRVDLVFTDPPYNMDYRSKKLGGLMNDSLKEAAFVRLILGSAGRMFDVLRPGGTWYLCMSSTEASTVHHQLRKLGMQHRVIVWAKPYPGLGSQDYRPAHELVLYGTKPPRSRRTWRGGRGEGDVWEFDPDRPVIARREGKGMVLEFGSGVETVMVTLARASTGQVLTFSGEVSDLWRLNRETGEYLHPTQKPVVMVERALRNSSRPGDLVLDSFAGSGTTLIACERLGRAFAGLELDPVRCDVVVRRWEQFTGRKAKRRR